MSDSFCTDPCNPPDFNYNNFMRNPDERSNTGEIAKANEFLSNEQLGALVIASVETHKAFLERLGADSGSEGMNPYIQEDLADLDMLRCMFQQDRLVYKVTHTRSGAVYISGAHPDSVEGDRLILDQEPNHTAMQVSIRITRPSDYQDPGDFLNISAEEAALRRSYRPLATVSIIPETVSLDSRRNTNFNPGAGITVDMYKGGYAEVFGSKGIGRHERVDREPLYTVEDASIDRLYRILPL